MQLKNILIKTIYLGVFISFYNTQAQVYINPTIPETTIFNLPGNPNQGWIGGPYVTVNCDMIDISNPHVDGNYKAIAWDNKDGTATEGYVYIENSLANNIIHIPNAADLDVVWADNFNNIGIDHYIAVVYWNNPYQPPSSFSSDAFL